MRIESKRLMNSLIRLARPTLGRRYLMRPVFLVGSGRSGTSYTAKLLGCHPEIAAFPGEALHLWHVNTYPYHVKRPDVPPYWIDPAAFSEYSVSQWPRDWEGRIQDEFGWFSRSSGRKVFLNKVVMNNFMLPKMLEIYPRAKFIHLVRNGLSVVLSYQKKEREKYQHPIYQKHVDPNDTRAIRAHKAQCWNDGILRVEQDRCDYFSQDNFLEIKYEDLISEPQATILRMLLFVGLKMSQSPDFVEKINLLSDKNYKARAELEDSEISSLCEVMRPALALKGYL